MADSVREPRRCSPAELKTLFLFESLSDEQLTMLCSAGHVETFEPGPLFTEGDPATCIYVLIEGELVSSRRSAGRDLEITRTSQPGVYCGGRSAFNAFHHDRHRLSVRLTRRSRFFVIGSLAFGEFVKSQFPMAVHLIDGLAEGAEKQTRMIDERDRLLALGQLAAALTHELNNPAAAVARAATELRGHIDALTSALVQNKLNRDALDFLSAAQADVVERVATASGRPTSAMRASDLEEDIGEWLCEHQIADAWDLAPAFVEAGLDTHWLDQASTSAANSEQQDWLGSALRLLYHRIEAELLTHQVHDAAQRISGLVADVKQYTHLDSAPFQSADVNALLHSTLRMFANQIEENTLIDVVTDFDSDIPELPCYPAELNQVWTSIIDNAIAAMRHSDEAHDGNGGTLTVRTRRVDDNVRVEIGDTGAGIPDDIRGRIFEPFFTTKPLGEGTGLGLHLAWRIVVHRHGGQLGVVSAPRDTRFIVTLPLNAR